METKRLSIPDDMAEYLGIDKETVNSKLKAIVDSKFGKTVEEITDGNTMIDDYDNFSREEILALFFDSASEAGYLRFKMDMLMQSGLIDMEKFVEFMENGNPDADLLGDLFKSPKDFL